MRPETASSASVAIVGALRPTKMFDLASLQVIQYLTGVLPMGLWAVTRVVEGRQLMLSTQGVAYGLGPGDEILFEASPCRAMVAGLAPQMAPDAASVPAYADCGVAAQIPLGAYIGAPIMAGDGQLFGTVCGFNPTPVPDSVHQHQPLLALLSSLLSAVLESDYATVAVQRRLELVAQEADRDQLTGLLNRRGWDRYIVREEERYRRFGDQASVVVMDLDRLKTINDIGGHAAGDDYLRLTAKVLESTVRSGDVLARLGGDEFGVIVTRGGHELVERLVLRMSTALDEAGVSGSFGFAPITVVTGFPGAWEAADSAMYEEKRRRKREVFLLA